MAKRNSLRGLFLGPVRLGPKKEKEASVGNLRRPIKTA